MQALYVFSPSGDLGHDFLRNESFHFYADSLEDAYIALQQKGYTGYVKRTGTDKWTHVEGQPIRIDPNRIILN